VEVRQRAGPFQLPGAELQQSLQVLLVPLLQERVGEHGNEGGAEGDGDPEGNAILDQPLEDLDQGEVGLGDGLE